jgi:predicted transcriptional regulator
MSIQPQFSKLIQDGTKTVELRRKRSGCEAGTPVVIYTSFPVKRVEAKATVKAVFALPPEELWQAVGEASASTYEAFMGYVGDLDVAYGIELEDVQTIPAFALESSGPQSWRYLFADEPATQSVLAASGL